MATDSMASPLSAGSLGERASEPCREADLDRAKASGRDVTQSSLSGAEAPKTREGESYCVQFKAAESPRRTGDGHSIHPSSTAADQVPFEEWSQTPQFRGTEPPKVGEVMDGTQEKTDPQPVVRAEGRACKKDGGLVKGRHTLIGVPRPHQVSWGAEGSSTETEPELQDAPDSVFLSDDAEDPSVDYKPLNFSSARKHWIQWDRSSSKPPVPAGPRMSFSSHAPDLPPFQTSPPPQPEETFGKAGARPAYVQQGEQQVQNPCSLKVKQEGQQVCEETPPMDTVARKPANLVAESPGGFIVLKEPLTEAGAEQEGEGEAERKSGQTSTDKKTRSASIHTAGVEKERRAEGEGDRSTETAQLQTKANAAAQLKTCRMEVDLYDDSQSDSGVSADFSPNSTGETSSSRTPICVSPEPGKPAPSETPIEREIRLAAERERSLRQARGLSSTNKAQEFVDIPIRRPILSKTLLSNSGKDKGKERQFAGKKMQREISQEAQREQDLVQLGRVPGFYERGTVRQLRERKLLFEAFQQPREMSGIVASQSLRIRTTSASTSDLSTLGPQGDESLASSSRCGAPLERRYSLDLLSRCESLPPQAGQRGGQARHTPPSACGPGLSEGTSSQVILLEGSRREVQVPTVVDSATVPCVKIGGSEHEQEEKVEEEEVEVNSIMVRENPFFKLRSSMSMRPEVEQDIRRAQERERELRRQRSSLYQGPAGARRNTPSPTLSQNGLLIPHQQPQTCSTTSSAQHSIGKSNLARPRPHKDPAQWEQAEALKSPPSAVKTPRQKTPLVQRWESGMVNGHGEDD